MFWLILTSNSSEACKNFFLSTPIYTSLKTASYVQIDCEYNENLLKGLKDSVVNVEFAIFCKEVNGPLHESVRVSVQISFFSNRDKAVKIGFGEN